MNRVLGLLVLPLFPVAVFFDYWLCGQLGLARSLSGACAQAWAVWLRVFWAPRRRTESPAAEGCRG